MRVTVYIFIGGGVGALLRYWLGHTLNGRALDVWLQGIPLGTLSANLIGSFFLGFIVGAMPTSTPFKSGLTTGLMGGLTTFSTLSLENAKLWESDQSLRALLHLTLHLSGGIILAIVGLSFGVFFGRKS